MVAEAATETAMAIFQVWHNQHPTFFNSSDEVLGAFPQGFEHVADVRTLEPGSVFQLTNHIDRDWTTNPEVRPVAGRSGRNTRSTSVGDIIVLTNPADDSIIGKWSVEMIGLKQF